MSNRSLRLHYVSKRYRWEINDLDKALTVIEAIRLMRPKLGIGLDGGSVKPGLVHLINKYPETRVCTHEHLADILCLNRESVTRAMKLIRIKNGMAK